MNDARKELKMGSGLIARLWIERGVSDFGGFVASTIYLFLKPFFFLRRILMTRCFNEYFFVLCVNAYASGNAYVSTWANERARKMTKEISRFIFIPEAKEDYKEIQFAVTT